MRIKRDKRDIGKKLFGYLDLPADVSSGEVFISIIGSRRIKVENHKGLLECTAASVAVRLKKGILRITGNSLVINELLSDALEVNGELKSVDFLT